MWSHRSSLSRIETEVCDGEGGAFPQLRGAIGIYAKRSLRYNYEHDYAA